MIYTVTINPSLDYYVTVPVLEMGKTNRSKQEFYLPGGKGLNVSMVLQNLSRESIALGFCAGFVGEELQRLLEEKKIRQELISLPSGNTRINIKFINMESTEVNASGPVPDDKCIDLLLEKCNQLDSKDWIIVNGSVPAGVDRDIYEEIARSTVATGATFVLDVMGENWENLLKYHPFLIKPNKQELEAFFGKTFTNNDEVIEYGRKLKDLGAKNVLISMAGDGAVLICEDGKIYQSNVPSGKFVNGVGAGDSMVAGFIHGYLQKQDYPEAFVFSMAAGSAGAYSKDLPTKEAILELVEECRELVSVVE